MKRDEHGDGHELELLIHLAVKAAPTGSYWHVLPPDVKMAVWAGNPRSSDDAPRCRRCSRRLDDRFFPFGNLPWQVVIDCDCGMTTVARYDAYLGDLRSFNRLKTFWREP